MECILLCVGKTDDRGLKELISTYQNRLKHYTKFSMIAIDDIKNSKHLSEVEQKQREGKALQKHLKAEVIALSFWMKQERLFLPSLLPNGSINNSSRASNDWSLSWEGPMAFPKNSIVWPEQKISLSCMTFSHQMVRLFFVEQLYRAHTILKNEPYHHR